MCVRVPRASSRRAQTKSERARHPVHDVFAAQTFARPFDAVAAHGG
jgi:hypothetical protein